MIPCYSGVGQVAHSSSQSSTTFMVCSCGSIERVTVVVDMNEVQEKEACAGRARRGGMYQVESVQLGALRFHDDIG